MFFTFHSAEFHIDSEKNYISKEMLCASLFSSLIAVQRKTTNVPFLDIKMYPLNFFLFLQPFNLKLCFCIIL